MDRCLTMLGSRTILSWLENCRQLLGNFEHPLTISLQMVVLAFLALLLKIILEYKRTITMTIHAWKIKGKGGSDHDIKSYEFFIKNHCVSCGWSFSEIEERKNIETLDDYKAFFKKYTKKDWNQQGVHQLFDNVKRGDFIWVRCGGVYYVAKVSQSPRSYFLSHYSKKARWSVKLVVVDLFESYRNLIHDLFPKAIIIADHFHVVAQAYRALQSARLKVMKESGPNTHEYRALKHYWKLLMAKEGQLDYLHYYPRRNFRYAWLSNQEVVKRLLNFSSELRAAYEYYQDLITAINQRSQSLLNQLIKQHNLPVTMRRVKRTLTKHRQEIIASFYTQLTNGPIEGTNNKIKVIKRTAYGYRNFFHFRIRILISLKTSNLMSRELSKKRTRPIANVA